MTKLIVSICSAFVALAVNTNADASLTITPAGSSLGFGLSTFVSGLTPNAGTVGPGGVAINGLGQVLVDSTGDGRVYVFANVDGQTRGSAITSATYTGFPPAFTNSGGLGGAVYGSGGYSNPAFLRFNNNGTIAQTYLVSGGGPTLGAATNPVNGHIFGTDGSKFYELDPVAGTIRTFGTSGGDGIAISFDGTRIYSSFGGIFSTSNGASLGSWGSVAGSDGVALIASANAALNGNLVVNSNNGTVVMVDLHGSGAQTIIASGGSRGDYVSPDFTNGSLFVTQSESVMRLTCGGNCSIGTVAEPTHLSLFLSGSAILIFAVSRRRRAVEA